MPPIVIDPRRTALIVIDLQIRIVGLKTAPHTGADVVRQSMRLAAAFRDGRCPVVIVQREWAGERQPVASELVEEMRPHETDLLVVRQGPDAFHLTGLHDELGKRGVTTLVLAGLVTEDAVESTARTAGGHGYELFLVEDAMTGSVLDAHDLAIRRTFPALGTVCTADQVLQAL